MVELMQLTKSLFLTYLDCPLHMWLRSRGTKGLEDSLFAKHIKEQGYIVEGYAKTYLQLLVERNYSTGSQLQFEVTLREEAFESRIDALIYDAEEAVYDLYEIKSSTSVHQEHFYDVTFQTLVARSSIPVRHTYVLHLNREYVRRGELALSKLFTIEELDGKVAQLSDEVIYLRHRAMTVLGLEKMPTELHCYKPSTCSYPEYCFPDLEEYSIYDLGRTTKKQFQVLLEHNIARIVDIPDRFPLHNKQQQQYEATKTKTPFIDRQAIQNELKSLTYPLYFLDYETFQEGIPRFDGYQPYQQAVTQFSLHICRNEEAAVAGEFDHAEYVATTQEDPAKALAAELCRVIGQTGSVVVWNKEFECGRNEELATLCPEYAGQLLGINERIYDLMEIFSKGYYVDYRFKGSASIKKVLPVLSPELSYEVLAIGEGTAAMLAWYEMVYGNVSERRREEIRKDLLAYCKMDTWAMVEIWRKVREVVEESTKGEFAG